MNENLMRVEKFRKDIVLHKKLTLLNRKISILKKEFKVNKKNLSYPVTFICGLQRSGTTLMYELLYRNFKFTYPDHIVAKFWDIPFIGVIISESIKYDFEKLGFFDDGDFSSIYGVINDVFGGHEFGYFWTKYFGFSPIHHLSEEKLKKVDKLNLKKDLIMMEHFGGKPLLFKATALSFNADFLAKIFPNALFVFSDRDLLYVAQSTYIARKKRYGDYSVWWSLKPKEYFKLKKEKPLKQIAGQVFYSKKRIDEVIERIPEKRRIVISYEDVCASPSRVVKRLRRFFPKEIESRPFKNPERFKNSNNVKIARRKFDLLRKYLKEYGEK